MDKEKIFEKTFGHKKLIDEVDTDWIQFNDIWKEGAKAVIDKFEEWFNLKVPEITDKDPMKEMYSAKFIVNKIKELKTKTRGER